MNWINGKKTYILSALAIAWAAYGVYSGNLEQDRAMEIILMSLGFSTIRHGVAKK